jgi:hypothetical protein
VEQGPRSRCTGTTARVDDCKSRVVVPWPTVNENPLPWPPTPDLNTTTSRLLLPVTVPTVAIVDDVTVTSTGACTMSPSCTLMVSPGMRLGGGASLLGRNVTFARVLAPVDSSQVHVMSVS